MRSTVKGERGMSLVEATIILMVLSLLTAVLAPSILDYVDDARRTKAKEDVEAIGIGIARLMKDTGAKFLYENAALAIVNRLNKDNKVQLLVSDGNTPMNDATVPAAATNTANLNPTSVDWDDALGDGVDSAFDQLVDNSPGYASPGTTMGTADPGDPNALGGYGMGWRGAYLSGVVGPDPWANRYACNTAYLGTTRDATTAGEGHQKNGWSFDVICLSAGPNSIIMTNWESTFSGAVGGGISFKQEGMDDILFVVTGYGR